MELKNKNCTQQIANCIAGAVVCVVSAPFLTVMFYRTLTLFEIRNDNFQVTVSGNPPYKNSLTYEANG
jgi:hypothetical protein